MTPVGPLPMRRDVEPDVGRAGMIEPYFVAIDEGERR